MRPRSRYLLRLILLGLSVITLVLAGLLGWWIHRPQPSYEGIRELPGLEQPVTVRYGLHAIPSIQAETLGDMLFAQGFVVARERLWQMDLLRRLAGGRLAELFGRGALVSDRFYRTIGMPRAVRTSFDALEPEWQQLLQRYADGVNAYRNRAVAEHRLPLEYQLLGLEASPWQPQDSLLVGAYMAWLNSVNLREELVFLRLAQRLGTERALELFPADQGKPAPTDASDLPDYRLELGGHEQSRADRSANSAANQSAANPVANPAARSARGPDLRSGRTASEAPFAKIAPAQALSNAWAITGSRTSDGAALLANDPHLPAVMPGTWYELEMQAPGYQAAGVSIPGVPWILIGHNADLAWGITAAVADTQDLFVERLSDDGESVLRPDGHWEPIQERIERIGVTGSSEPRQIDLPIRSTRHGVLIDGLVATPGSNPTGLATIRRPTGAGWRLALRLARDRPDRAFVGLYRLNTATSLSEARAAAEDLQHVALNLLFAHRDGQIAWQVSGLLPHRGRGSGTFPVPGWQPGYGWTGYRPFAQNPWVRAPSDELLVSANHAMGKTMGRDADGTPAISHSWLAPFRAQRIEALLDADEQFDLERMAQMQSDRVSLEAAVYLASLRRHLPEIGKLDPEAAALAEDRLLSWSLAFEDESQAAGFFVLLRSELYRALYADELGDDIELLMDLDTDTYGPLAETMYSDESSFWDDIETAEVIEGPATIWARALRASAAALRDAVDDRQAPRLDELRQLTFAHAFDGQPLLGGLFNLGPIGRGGDNGTIDVAIARLTRPREIGNVASMRVVYAPSDWSETRGTLPLGQSGHRFSRYRSDQLEDWLNGRSHPWPWDGPAAGQALGTLVLRPVSD